MNISPINNTKLYGYSLNFSNLAKLYSENKLPNKIIFSGKKGIGKSTLAYHLANYIFSISDKDKYDINDLNGVYEYVYENNTEDLVKNHYLEFRNKP